MAVYETLVETHKPRLSDMNQSRIEFLSKLIIALISCNTLSYEYLAQKIETITKLSSVYRSIQRVFAVFEIDDFTAATLIASHVPINQCGWILTFDRTNWKLGKINNKFLVLAVAYNGVAITLFWHLLDKCGDSNWIGRIGILNRFNTSVPLWLAGISFAIKDEIFHPHHTKRSNDHSSSSYSKS